MLGIRRYRLSPFFSDVFWTFIAQGCVLVLGILLFRLAAKTFGPDGFGEYTLARRIVSVSQPLVLLALGAGLPRYMSTVLKRDPAKQASYVIAASACTASATLLVLTVLNLFPSLFSKILFGDSKYNTLIPSLSAMILGIAACSFLYSYYRGRMLMKVANLFQVVSIGILPVFFLLVVPDCTVRLLIMLTGVGLCATTVVFGPPLVKEILNREAYQCIGTSLKELLRYGLARIPGDLAFYGLLALGPIIAAHFAQVEEVGYLSVSLSVVLLMSVVVNPLSIVLLPVVSRLFAQGEKETIRRNLNYLIVAVLHISIFMTFQLTVFADLIVRYWLGSEFLEACMVMRIVLLSIPSYLIYVALRSSIDAASVKAINARNIYVSLAAFLVFAGIVLLFRKSISPIIGLSMALIVSFSVLGLLTYFSATRIFKLSLAFRTLPLVVLINIVLVIIALLLKPFMRFELSGLIILAIMEIVVFVVYLLLLKFCRIKWPGELLKKVSRYGSVD